jgi:hypothetical protein
MNKELIPQSLHHLIPLVEKWGIEDDGYRDNVIFNSSVDELKELVFGFSDNDADNLNKWLIDPYQIKKCTAEYLKYSAFFMAYEYAESLLKSRKLI